MWNAAFVKEMLHDAKQFGFDVGDVTFDWPTLKTRRDAYVKRLNGIYERLLAKSEVTFIKGRGTFVGPNAVEVNGTVYEAEHVAVTVGGYPRPVPAFPGSEHTINSDGFFELEEQPGKAVVVGGGYIAVELAGVLSTLGTDVTIFARSGLLRKFDSMLQSELEANYTRMGINITKGASITSITLGEDGKKTVAWSKGEEAGEITGVDTVLYAIGRVPATAGLGLEAAGVETTASGHIVVKDWDTHETSAAKTYALGDVIGRADLTPVAIAAGRSLVDRLFGPRPEAKLSYDLIPTVVFSHPTIGTVGLTQEEAEATYGAENLKVYTSKFTNLFYGTFQVEPEDKPKTNYKVICYGPDQRVVGVHIMGMGSDEVMQGFGVAVKMGATKADLDACIAIHPTAGEELVTFQPWNPTGAKAPGLPPPPTSAEGGSASTAQ